MILIKKSFYHVRDLLPILGDSDCVEMIKNRFFGRKCDIEEAIKMTDTEYGKK